MMDIELSIIIVSFNTKDLLRSCLQSICSTITTVAYEIIVVDNNSKDGSPKMIENEFKDLRLIKNEDNYGFAKANNQAIKIAKGKYLLLLNSDTILIDGAIENLNKFIDEKPNAAAVGPKVINFDETLQSKGYSFPSILLALITFFRFPKFLSEKKIAHWFPKYFWNENDIRQVDWISGCCMLIRREVINKIGMLSEDFFMYGEDAEWCFRAQKAGYEIWYVPFSQIKHLNRSSPLQNKTEIERINTKIFYKKTIGIFKAIMISIIYIFSNSITMLRAKIRPVQINEYNDTKIKIKEGIRFIRFLLQ